jgi:hypothetical protein
MTSDTAGKAIDGPSLRRPHHKTAAHRRRYPQGAPIMADLNTAPISTASITAPVTVHAGSANTGHAVVIAIVIAIVINKTHSIVHGVFARCFGGVFGLFVRSDPRWDPCILAPVRADPGTFSVAGIRIRANFGARIRSHLPAGPPGALVPVCAHVCMCAHVHVRARCQ